MENNRGINYIMTTVVSGLIKIGKTGTDNFEQRGFTWFDSGTMDSLMDAANFVRMIERRQGVMVCAPEEIAFWQGWISKEKLLQSAMKYGNSSYGRHLKPIADGRFISTARKNL